MILLGLTVLLAAPGEAPGRAAQLLERSRELLGSLRYKEALHLAEEGLSAGDAHGADVQGLYVVVAESSAAINLSNAASEAYQRVLLLNPGFMLSNLASPKLREPFEAAQRALGGVRLRVTPQVSPVAGSRYRARVSVEGDLFHWVQGGTLYVQRGEDFAPVELVFTDVLRAELECQGRCGYFVVLRDGVGNELIGVGSASALLFPEVPQSVARAVTPPAPAPRRWYRHPATYETTAAILGAASGVLYWRYTWTERALISVNADRNGYFLDQARSLDAARNAEHSGMWICIALASLAALVGVIVW